MEPTVFANAQALAQAIEDAPGAVVRVEHDRASDMAPLVMAVADAAARAGNNTAVVFAGDAFSLRGHLAYCAGLVEGNLVEIQDLCLGVLRAHEGEESVRSARMLDANEIDVLIEDLKVTGLKQGRLREMLKFFYRSMAEYECEQEGWIYTAEEDMVFNILTANLEARRAYLPYELASAAFRAQEGEALYDVVVAVGFESMSKSEQRLLAALASRLVAFGTAAGVATPDQDYPYPEGFAALEQSADACLKYAPERPRVREHVRCATTPTAEFDDIAAQVRYALEDGVAPQRIAVATPNRVWARQVASALSKAGIPACMLEPARKATGDPRVPEKCDQIRAVCALKLAANPSDTVALRTWLGVGEWLMNSDAFGELMAYMKSQGKTMLEALDEVRAAGGAKDDPFPSAQKFTERLAQADRLVEACAGKTGPGLVRALSDEGVEVPEWIAATVEDGRDAAGMLDAALAPAGREDGCVVVGSYRACATIPAGTLFVAGLVNGFLPTLDALSDGKTVDFRTRMLAHDQDLFNQLRACASGTTTFSYFKRDRFENADALHMQVERITMKDGVRYATLSPSQFIEALIGKD